MQISVDYLAFSVAAEKLAQICEAFNGSFGEPTAKRATGRWSDIVQWGGSAAVMFDLVEAYDQFLNKHTEYRYDRIFVELKGAACALLGWEGLCRTIEAVGVIKRVTRLDVALDVFTGVPTIRELSQRYTAPGSYGPYRSCRSLIHHDDAGGGGVYFGSREGGREVCVYDKRVQSSAAVGQWVRFEARYYGAQDRADDAFRHVFGFLGPSPVTGRVDDEPGRLAERAGELVGGAIEFKEPDGKVASWWGLFALKSGP